MQLYAYRNTERSARYTAPMVSEEQRLASQVAFLEKRKAELSAELKTMVKAREDDVRRRACERKLAEAEMARIREQHRQDFGREVAEYARQRKEALEEIEVLRGDVKLGVIARRICRATGITLAELRSHRRSEILILARLAFYYWSCRLTQKSLPQIGRFIDRDHTSILHGKGAYVEKRKAMGRHLRPVR